VATSEARSPAPASGAICAIGTDGHRGTNWFTDSVAGAGLIIREAILHRLFGHKTLCIGTAEIVAALGTGFCVIFPSLMIGIDQSIVPERRNTFAELINGVLLCGSEHFESLSLGDNVTEVCRF
jgi:hypothetical protein